MSKLQESRKKEIPNLVEKYKLLVDETFKIVTTPLPVYENLENEKGEVIQTAEQKQFIDIENRNKALDNANQMLVKVNLLEIELNAPEILEKEKEEEEESEGKPKKNWTKKIAEEGK